MAKASGKRAGKKRKAKKAAGKKVRARKASAKAARKRAAPKAKRKAAKAKRSKPKAAKRMPKAPAMMPPRGGESWPMIFAVVVALLAGIAVMWHFGGITIAAAATMPVQMLAAPAASAVYAGCDVIASADTWLALAHADFVPGLR